MTDEWFDLIERYREQFGDAPPIFWADSREKHAQDMEMMKQALETGEPWVRPELEKVPDGVLI
jgi:hypothetical protein